MCGIAGFIGRSKKPKLSFELTTQLFEHLEMRGIDAAGVWATEIGDGRVFYHKEPVRSSEFVKEAFWQKLGKVKLDLLLVHARATSTGHASINSNNHPFVSKDKRIGMVHNGTLSEFQHLKERYQILSDTDSELLLRMYEHGLKTEAEVEQPEDRLQGIKDIWSYISEGAMAVAIGERPHADIRYLFLFHNNKRPLWIADLRKPLGQIFFFSSPEVWYRAISSSLKRSCVNIPDLIEIPVNQVWVLWLDGDNPMLLETGQVWKYDLDVKPSGQKWEAGEMRPIKEPVLDLEVVSGLGQDEQVENSDKHEAGWKHETKQEKDGTRTATLIKEPDWPALAKIKNSDHVDLCNKIVGLAQAIETKANNQVIENSISANTYQELVEFLEQTATDLQGTLALLG